MTIATHPQKLSVSKTTFRDLEGMRAATRLEELDAYIFLLGPGALANLVKSSSRLAWRVLAVNGCGGLGTLDGLQGGTA